MSGRNMNNSGCLDKIFNPLGCMVIVVIVLAVVFFPVFTQRPVSGILLEQFIKMETGLDGKPVEVYHLTVLQDDGAKEIFQNRDNLAFLKTYSGDMQSDIRLFLEKDYEVRCDFLITGLRVELVSAYPNVVSMTCPAVSPSPPK